MFGVPIPKPAYLEPLNGFPLVVVMSNTQPVCLALTSVYVPVYKYSAGGVVGLMVGDDVGEVVGGGVGFGVVVGVTLT